MLNLVAADLIVLLHFTYILFVVFGGLFVFKWRLVAWGHIPCVIWGVIIEFTGWICPLTPIENMLRYSGGGAGYSNSFIEHYLLPVIYPTGLTRELQLLMGVAVIAINVVIYTAYYFMKVRQKH
ncbi:MAG: DUF2784 domain-containing protein [Gammaproteobacteria bacterium]|nr:DUF2784 domain-containing protein [Gammaproteobacteria bacterium]